MTTNPVSDNCCTRMGWIEAFAAPYSGTELHISYPPEADLDDTFKAFCHDEQEMIIIKGWLTEINPITAD